MKEIKNKTFEEERSLYNLSDALVDSCQFSGKADGESPLKESNYIKVINSHFDLRYSFWHVTNGVVEDTTFSNTARAPFWYSKNLKLNNVKSEAVKVFRECENVIIENSTFTSEEPFWKCSNINVNNSKLFNLLSTIRKNIFFNNPYKKRKDLFGNLNEFKAFIFL